VKLSDFFKNIKQKRQNKAKQRILLSSKSIMEAEKALGRPLSEEEVSLWKSNYREQQLGKSPGATSLRDDLR
jgi:hypothetical protein